MSEEVNSQVTDAVTQTNAKAVGETPAVNDAAAQIAAQAAATQAMLAFMGGAAPMGSAERLSPVGSDLEALETSSD